MHDEHVTKRSGPVIPDAAFAQLGGGQIAYMKPLNPDEVHRLFPQVPPVQPDTTLYALFGAEGRPMALSDNPKAVIASALQHDLTMVSLH